jgi:DNA-binding CsgD family transcriptional regulator
LLASGHSLSACAKDLGRSVETCRAHLKAIFGKINVSRQGDLIRLILTTPAWIDPA